MKKKNASVDEGGNLGRSMQKALAQNPNLLRTLLGLSFTLIFLLAYAVYGATISPSYYVYETDNNSTVDDQSDPTKLYDDEANETTWRWTLSSEGDNLTWVNVTATELSRQSTIRLINSAGLYSHSKLGDPDAEDFACEDKLSLIHI